jgi:hypothetical protein
MPSHIFARLGYWQDDIQSNLASKAAAEKQADTPARSHAMDFLEYAYLQAGETDKARAIEEEALRIPAADFTGSMADHIFYLQVHFPSLLGLETRDWKAVSELRAPFNWLDNTGESYSGSYESGPHQYIDVQRSLSLRTKGFGGREIRPIIALLGRIR